MITWFKTNEIIYYLTPYAINDDLFILWFFLKTKSTAFLISNDKFRDHIFKFETSQKKLKSDFNLNQFYHIIQQQKLEYNIDNYKINSKPIVSKCIQVIDNNIFVPHNLGNFIKISL